ncbi:putative quinol monooxygenase [Kineococcus sp. GCM10028916]|uniref:putative quinol monooxygenase n=1 Tax=Kineococcus sp. GCM10028916 TaxID=3273394 RepID=UPI00362C1D78
MRRTTPTPGGLRFSVGRDIRHPGRYQLIELWANQELLDEHSASEAFRRTVEALGSATSSRCDRTGTKSSEHARHAGRPAGPPGPAHPSSSLRPASWEKDPPRVH